MGSIIDVPSEKKYAVVSARRFGSSSPARNAAGPLSIANAVMRHMLPNVKLSANLDGRIMI